MSIQFIYSISFFHSLEINRFEHSSEVPQKTHILNKPVCKINSIFRISMAFETLFKINS
jgi:hypothetical protein